MISAICLVAGAIVPAGIVAVRARAVLTRVPASVLIAGSLILGLYAVARLLRILF